MSLADGKPIPTRLCKSNLATIASFWDYDVKSFLVWFGLASSDLRAGRTASGVGCALPRPFLLRAYQLKVDFHVQLRLYSAVKSELEFGWITTDLASACVYGLSRFEQLRSTWFFFTVNWQCYSQNTRWVVNKKHCYLYIFAKHLNCLLYSNIWFKEIFLVNSIQLNTIKK